MRHRGPRIRVWRSAVDVSKDIYHTLLRWGTNFDAAERQILKCLGARKHTLSPTRAAAALSAACAESAILEEP